MGFGLGLGLKRKVKKIILYIVLYSYRWGPSKLAAACLCKLEKIQKGPGNRCLYRLKVMSVREYLQHNAEEGKYIVIEPEYTFVINALDVIGAVSKKQQCYHHKNQVRMPELYLAKLKQVCVVGGTELIIAQKKFALYDEIAFYNRKHYGVKNRSVVNDYSALGRPLLSRNKEILLSANVNKMAHDELTMPKAVISLCKDFSINYFHWLTECLPKMKYINEYIDPRIPLLIEDDHPSQNIEALRYCDFHKRKIYLIRRGYIHPFEEVYSVGSMSHSHENLFAQVSPEDLMISPDAVIYLRETFLSAAFLNNSVGEHENFQPVKLYVSRSSSSYRKLINEQEIQEYLTKQGYIVVNPSQYSFKEQVDLFSRASVIVGQSGAGLTNIVFSPKNCRVFILTGDVVNANFYSYASLAQHAGVKLKYVVGRSISQRAMHSDFYVSLTEVKDLVLPSVFEFRN